MLRFLLATLVASSALFATPVAFTSCTAGTATVSPCGGSVDFPGGITSPTYSVTAFSDGSDSSIVSGVLLSPLLSAIPGQTLSTVAEGEAGGSSPPVIQLTAVSQASAGGTFYTSGPLRAGFIEFVVQVDHLHGGDASASLSDGTHTYGYDAFGVGSTPSTYCGIDGCGWMAKEPFDLGSTFQVSTDSDAGESLLTSPTFQVFHGFDDSIVMFRLLESDGKTPVPFSATPEPATWALLLFGLGVVAWAGSKRRAR